MKNAFLTKDQVEDLLEYIGVDKVGMWKDDKIQFCCPIHGESHPSCGINVDYDPDDGTGNHYQVFHCFSCGESGSLVWFLFKSLPDQFKSIYEAEAFINARYGIEYKVADNHIKRSLKRFEDVRNTTPVKEVSMSKLAPFKSGLTTYKYFFQRGFDKSDLEYWKVGRDKESRTVTIPVFSQNDKLVGVIGRYIDPDRPKNSRYRIYDFPKSKFLFAENKLVVSNDTIIGVEGMFDCMLLHKWGRTNTVSIMGNKMSNEQADFIATHCKKFIGLWDNDEGGIKAAEIAKKRLSNRVSYLSCDYTDVMGKDPTDWGEIQTNKILSTASIIKHKIRRI